MQKLGTKPKTASFWLLSKSLRYDNTISRVVNIRFPYSQTTTTSAALWIQKIWAPDKSVGPKSSLTITFTLIINRVRLIELQMLYRNIFSKIPKKTIFWTKNTKILHWLQSSLANVFGIFLDVFLPFYQIFVCSTAVLPQLQQFWEFFQGKIVNESFYNVSIRAMRLRLPDL